MSASDTKTTVGDFHDHQVEARFGPLFVRVWAQGKTGTPILLLHDSLGSIQLWRDFPQALAGATGRSVIAYDRAGFGHSVVRKGRISPDFILAETEEGIVPVIEALGLKEVVLLGHSVGGGMALAAAAALGERVAGVIPIAAQSFVEDVTLAGVREAEETFAQPGQVDRLMKYHGERAPWILQSWIETWLAPGYANWSLESVLPRIKVPVLAMHGAMDEFGSNAHPQMITQLVSGPARMRLFDGVAHMPHREVTSQVLKEIQLFLAELRPDRSHSLNLPDTMS